MLHFFSLLGDASPVIVLSPLVWNVVCCSFPLDKGHVDIIFCLSLHCCNRTLFALAFALADHRAGTRSAE